MIRLLPYILGGIFVLGVLLFLYALHQLRLRRTGAYWRLRRRAGDRGGKLFVLSVFLMAASLVLTVFTGLASVALRDVSEYLNRGPDDLYGIVLPPDSALTETREAVVSALTATRVQLETLTPATPVPSTLTDTPVLPTPTRTPTPTQTDTPTVTPTLSPLLNLTVEFNTTPRPARDDFRLTLDAASDDATAETDTSQPRFAADIRRIYLFFSYENMDNGVAWSRVLYRDGVPVQGNTLLWSLGTAGSSYFFFGSEAGYEAGAYEARLFVGDREASRYTFSVN
ncbi:MAG: hypothetical protein IT319_18865 [Anaerolineae bacterium]|nr:hypothetical protein [Anaerolineae bacterium]